MMDKFCWCSRFHRGLWPSKDQKRVALVIKQPTVLCPPSITTAYKCTLLVRHKMWGQDLLGGGLSAFSRSPRLPSYVRSTFLLQTRDEEASCWLWALKQQLIKVIPLRSHSCNKNNKAVVAGPCILYAKFSKHRRCCGFIKWKQSWHVETAAVSVSCCSAKQIFTFDSQFCHFAVQSYYANADYARLWGWLAVFRLQGVSATSSNVVFLILLTSKMSELWMIVPCFLFLLLVMALALLHFQYPHRLLSHQTSL